jgi:hypothetical protein
MRRSRRASCSPCTDGTTVRGCHDEGAVVFYVHELPVQSMCWGSVGFDCWGGRVLTHPYFPAVARSGQRPHTNSSARSVLQPVRAARRAWSRLALRFHVARLLQYRVNCCTCIYTWRSIQSKCVGSFSLPSQSIFNYTKFIPVEVEID